jgi:Recombination endonuclease VII
VSRAQRCAADPGPRFFSLLLGTIQQLRRCLADREAATSCIRKSMSHGENNGSAHVGCDEEDEEKRRKKARERENARRRNRYHNDPEYREKQHQTARRAWRKYRLSRYGLTVEAYEALLARQDGACAICGTKFEQTPCVDHCRKTKKVRGLLCSNCNVAVGLFREDPNLLRKAATYLEEAVIKSEIIVRKEKVYGKKRLPAKSPPSSDTPSDHEAGRVSPPKRRGR